MIGEADNASAQVVSARGSAIRSIRRGFQIFELFDIRREPLSASDIARALDAPLSSILDVLRSISALGYITYDSRARMYFPSLRTALLGSWIEMSLFGDETLESMLREIGEVTRETVVISAINDLDMQYLWVIPGPQAIGLTIEQGRLVSIFDTAIGQALMARWTDEEIRNFIKRYQRRRAKDRKPAAQQVLAQVEDVRRRGYACAYDNALDSVGAIAVSIGLSKERNLVIGVGGPSDRIRENETEIASAMQRIVRAYRH